MNKFWIMRSARVSAEVLREDYDVPVYRATTLERAARGAALELLARDVEVKGIYVTNELVTGDELGIRIETNQMLIDIQAYPREDDNE